MSFSFKAVGRGLGAILAVGGVLLLVIGTSTSRPDATSAGWGLVALSVALWLISLISRKI